MDSETAKSLFEKGAMFIMLDFPVGSEFGINCQYWDTGPNFRGVKMIPAGLHFVYYSARNKENQVAPRSGFFHFFKEKEILVKKWNPKVEDLEDVSAEDMERIRVNKEEIDRYLGPFPFDSYKKWVSMTNKILPDVLSRLQPECGRVCAVASFESEKSTNVDRQRLRDRQSSDTSPPDVNARQESRIDPENDPRLPVMTKTPGTEIKFSQIPKQKYPSGASPAEISKYSMDHSYVLERIIQSEYEGVAVCLLGELQFAFVCFLIGQIYDAFEQWKKLVDLLCSSYEALTAHTDLYLTFIAVMHFQIREIPEDFFTDIVTQNNFLTTTLQTFFYNVESRGQEVTASLSARALQFRRHLESRFKWDFTVEDEDDGPVVVMETSCPLNT